jgi:hypothetical protein
VILPVNYMRINVYKSGNNAYSILQLRFIFEFNNQGNIKF